MLYKSPANQDAANRQKRLVDVGSALVPHPQPPELAQPRQRPFHHPPVDAQPAPVRRIPFRNHRLDAPRAKLASMRLAGIPPVALSRIRPLPGTSDLAPHRRNRVHQRQQLRHVVGVRSSQNRGERDALGVRDEMVFAARFRTIRGIGTRFRPPKTARSEALSATARDQSIPSACCSLTRQILCSFPQRPSCFHSVRWFQHVIPQPHPISWGKSSHGMPVRSTNRIPVSTFRWSAARRPGYRNRLGCGGISGAISSHNSSGNSSLAMCFPPSGIGPTQVRSALFSHGNSSFF